MQIISIKASKIPNRVWLSFSDNSFIPFSADDVVKLSLAKNQEITEEKFNQIIQSALFFLGREYALRQIAVSPKTEKIIYQKLKIFFRKIFSKYKINYFQTDGLIEEIINYLQSKNLLNPQDFVAYFIKKNSKKSHQQIVYLLNQFGIDKSYLSSVKSDQSADIDKIKKIISKKKSMDKMKLKALLYRRGFSLFDINTAFDDQPNFG